MPGSIIHTQNNTVAFIVFGHFIYIILHGFSICQRHYQREYFACFRTNASICINEFSYQLMFYKRTVSFFKPAFLNIINSAKPSFILKKKLQRFPIVATLYKPAACGFQVFFEFFLNFRCAALSFCGCSGRGDCLTHLCRPNKSHR